MKRWTSLTWDDLAEWAGSRSVERGRNYQREGCVEDLVISDTGRLLATVMGGNDYLVSVWFENKKASANGLKSICTCPVGYRCKHAIAVVAQCLDLLAHDKAVPLDNSDSRWSELQDTIGNDEDENYEEPARGRRRSRQGLDDKIRKHIKAKSQEELVELVWLFTQRFPEIHDEFRERVALDQGDVDKLVAEARRELRRLTAEPGWTNSWTGAGHVPDYDKLIHRLERLVATGYQDSVVDLGREIIARGMQHAGESNDEGETGSAFSECLPIIFKAVAESKLPEEKKVLFAIDAYLEDHWGIIGDAADIVMEEDFSSKVWSAVAEELAQRLASLKTNADFSSGFRRDQLSSWVAESLINANRKEEALALYEQEVHKTGSYERLVKFLIELKRYPEAQRWTREGIEKTAQQLPGIASHLAGSLNEIAKCQQQWDIVAAYTAWRFFDNPSQEAFIELINAAAKAGCEDKVRQIALHFLETGISPMHKATSQKEKDDTSIEWPLPVPDYLAPILERGQQPRSAKHHYDVLIDMAIDSKRHEDVLHWYDQMCATRGRSGWYEFDYSDTVAEAVRETHPWRSLDIYQQCLNEKLTRASKSAYESAVSYLRKMRPIFKSLGRESDWTQLIADLRLRHRNRPRFVEMLERLDDRTILQIQKSRK